MKNRLDLLRELVKTSFKMRYQNSVLGVLWVLIKPYTTFVVLYFLWTNIRDVSTVENYSLYLLIGIIFYSFFSEMISLGQMALLDKANIILKVSFPRQIAIIASLFNALINLIINLVLIFIIMILVGHSVSFEGLLYFVFLCISAFILCLGIAMFTSIATIRFRDLKNIFDLGLFLLYWATPIIYVLEGGFVGDSLTGQLIRYQPLTILINQVRASFGIYGDVNYEFGIMFFIASILILVVGWQFFSNRVKRVAEFF